jgi:prolipoprotein diacylglyceryltransferase
MMLLSIPSPSDPYLFRLGPFQPRWYGVLLACGVLLAGWIARREFRRRSVDPDPLFGRARGHAGSSFDSVRGCGG